MKFAERPLLATLAGATVLLAATGCSVLEPDKIDYKSSGRGVSLEVPPDLTQLPGQSRYAAQSGAVTASGYQAGQVATAAAGTPTAANKVADVQFMRQDGERWRDEPAGRFYLEPRREDESLHHKHDQTALGKHQRDLISAQAEFLPATQC